MTRNVYRVIFAFETIRETGCIHKMMLLNVRRKAEPQGTPHRSFNKRAYP